MAPQLYGLDADLAKKAAEKHSPEREGDARAWIEQIAEIPHSTLVFQEWLKDGQVLMTLAVKLGLSKAKIVSILNANEPQNNSKMAFKQMENIGNFLQALDQLGMRSEDNFQTVDLFENKNMNSVVDTIYTLARLLKAKGLCKVALSTENLSRVGTLE